MGATVQHDLNSTVLRFRTHQVCFTADIVTMEIFSWGTHPRVPTHHSNIWTFLSSIPGNTLPEETTNSTASTNRKVLAITASIFNPLGLLSPAVIACKYFYRNCGKTLKWDKLFLTHLQQEWNQLLQTIPKWLQLKITGRLFAPMQPTSKSMDSATAVKESMEPAYIFTPQITTTQLPVNFVQLHCWPCCTRRPLMPQYNNKWVLLVDRFFHCTDMDTGSTK